jgi:hypothetical protein
MSYINVKLLKSKNLSLIDLQILQLSKQQRVEDVSEVLSEYSLNVDKLIVTGYLEFIKGKKGDGEFQKIRTTKLGAETLDLISTPLITEGDVELYKYLCTMYLQEDSSRTLGNRKAGLRYSSEFRQIMGFTLYEAYYLYEMFIINVEYTKVLEFIFFEKKNNPYGKFKDNLASSKIMQFWEDNEYEVREYWEKKIKKQD